MRRPSLDVVAVLAWPVRAGVDLAAGTVRLAKVAPAFPRTLAEIPGLLRDAHTAMERIHALVDQGEQVARQADQVAHQAALIAQHVEAVAARADDVRATADRLVTQAEQLLDGITPLARAAARHVDVLTQLVEAAAAVDPDTVRSLARLGDRFGPLLETIAGRDSEIAEDTTSLVRQLPTLLDQFDSSVLPALDEMRQAVPDVRAILPLVEKLAPVLVDVETRIAGLPGSSRLRRRGQKEIAEATDVDVRDLDVGGVDGSGTEDGPATAS